MPTMLPWFYTKGCSWSRSNAEELRPMWCLVFVRGQQSKEGNPVRLAENIADENKLLVSTGTRMARPL
jgi:hypothetical protein